MIDDHTRNRLRGWADLYADDVQGKMGHPKRASFFRGLIERGQFGATHDILNYLSDRADYLAAVDFVVEVIAQKPGWER